MILSCYHGSLRNCVASSFCCYEQYCQKHSCARFLIFICQEFLSVGVDGSGRKTNTKTELEVRTICWGFYLWMVRGEGRQGEPSALWHESNLWEEREEERGLDRKRFRHSCSADDQSIRSSRQRLDPRGVSCWPPNGSTLDQSLPGTPGSRWLWPESWGRSWSHVYLRQLAANYMPCGSISLREWSNIPP